MYRERTRPWPAMATPMWSSILKIFVWWEYNSELALLTHTRTTWVLDRRPIAAEPCLNASMAYSTWKSPPAGDHVVTSVWYWFLSISEIFFWREDSSALLTHAGTTSVLDRRPIAVEPCLNASMAYSTWKSPPGGGHVVTSVWYWFLSTSEIFFRRFRREDNSELALLTHAGTTSVLDRRPIAAEPCLTASMAYSTWKSPPGGGHVVTSVWYWFLSTSEIFFRRFRREDNSELALLTHAGTTSVLDRRPIAAESCLTASMASHAYWFLYISDFDFDFDFVIGETTQALLLFTLFFMNKIHEGYFLSPYFIPPVYIFRRKNVKHIKNI